MPHAVDATTSADLPGLFRSLWSLLDLLPSNRVAPVALVATVTAAAALIAATMRGRAVPATASASVPSRVMPREEALGHVRRLKAELKGRKGEAAVADVLARAGLPALHDVVLRDGRGLTQVDHLVRWLGGIVVIETKALAGTVTGSVRDRCWVQHLRGGEVRTAFQNPLLQNHRHVRAVRELAGAGVPVSGLVVSAGAGQFCGELGAAVVRLADLDMHLRALPTMACCCNPAHLDAAWARLTAAAACSVELRGEHGEQVRHRRGEMR